MRKMAFTGHRPDKLDKEYACEYDDYGPLQLLIYRDVLKLINEHKPEILITGMALGLDTLVATLAIRENIPFIAAIPCTNQSSLWFPNDKRYYKKLLSNPLCDPRYVSDKEYFTGCMSKRNKWMVDQLVEFEDKLVAVWDGTTGGTYDCIRYAGTKIPRVDIIRIDPMKLREELKNPQQNLGL